MPQFDVYPAPGRKREGVPFVVDVQSHRYAALLSRIVIPLMADRPQRSLLEPDHVPHFLIHGGIVFLNPFEMRTVHRSLLRHSIASLAGDNDSARIIAAIDLVITRAYG